MHGISIVEINETRIEIGIHHSIKQTLYIYIYIYIYI